MMQPVQPNPGGFQYHIMGVDGREYGPVEVAELQQWLAQGQMTAQTQVRRSHEPQWQPAMSMPELQPLLGTVGGPPVVGAVMPQAPVNSAKEATAKKLVLASHILGYGGLVVLFGGSIIAGIVIGGGAAGISAIIGLAMAIIGAIVGQVGRGMQGRAI